MLSMSHAKLFFGALSIAGLGFGAGYYCATDGLPAYAEVAPAPAEEALEQQFAAALDEIRRLQAGDEAGSSVPRDFPNALIRNQKAYAVLLDKLDKLPQSLIDSQLEKYFGRESLEKIEDTRAFSKRLLEVALEDQDQPLKEDGPLRVDIQLSKSPMYGNRMLSQDVVVTKFEPLFAHIVTANELGDVIIKWQDVNSGEILIFNKMNFGPGSQLYISAIPGSGWRNSQYRVSVSSMDESVELMAASSYNISQVNDAVPGPNHEVIDDLVLMGLAVPKKSVK